VNFNRAEYYFIVGIARAGNNSIKLCTSLVKLALLVFLNLNLNCGPIKNTLIPSQVDFLFHLGRVGSKWYMWREGSLM